MQALQTNDVVLCEIPSHQKLSSWQVSYRVVTILFRQEGNLATLRTADGQLRSIHFESLHQSHTGCTADTTDNCGVRPGRQSD